MISLWEIARYPLAAILGVWVVVFVAGLIVVPRRKSRVR
jgi:hypothetical protein